MDHQECLAKMEEEEEEEEVFRGSERGGKVGV